MLEYIGAVFCVGESMRVRSDKRWVLEGLLVIALLCSPVFCNVARADALEVRIDESEIFENEWVEMSVGVGIDQVFLDLTGDQDFRVEQVQGGRSVFCMVSGNQIMSGPCHFTFRLYPKRTGELIAPVFQLRGDGFFRPSGVIARGQEYRVTVKSGQGDKQQRKQAMVQNQGGQGGMMGGPGGMMGGPGGMMMPPQMRRPGMQMPNQPQKEMKIYPADKEESAESLSDLSNFAGYDAFVLPRLSRLTPVLSEPVILEHLLYVARGSSISSIQNAQMPESEGFRQEPLESELKEIEGQELSGRQYQVFTLGKVLLIPLEAGRKRLKSPKVVTLGQKTSYQQGPGGFSISFSSNTEPMDVNGPALVLDVKSTPKPVAPGFSDGNVGRFELFDLKLPTQTSAGAWLFLRYRVRGEGNLLGLTVPGLTPRQGLVLREAAVDRSGVKVGTDGISGEIEVSIPFRLEKPGAVNLGELKLVYFDPERQEYRESALLLPTIDIQPATAETAALEPEETALKVTPNPVVPPDFRQGSADSGKVEIWFVFVNLGLLLLALTPSLIALAVQAVSSLNRRRRRRALAELRSFLGSGRFRQLEILELYGELTRLLRAWLGEQYHLPLSLGPVEVETALLAKGHSAAFAHAIRSELENCDFARYAPGAAGVERREELRERVLGLLKEGKR